MQRPTKRRRASHRQTPGWAVRTSGVRPAGRTDAFNSGDSVTLVVFGREGRHVGVAEHRDVPTGRFRARDNPRVAAQQVGAEQPDSQLMMADERGRNFALDARRSEHALLTSDHPCIEQQEIDRPTSLETSAASAD